MRNYPVMICYFSLIILSGCHAVTPDTDTGVVVDASRNVSSALYHPVARPDNPNPVQSFVFIRHFFYTRQQSPWSIVSSGLSAPAPVFEDVGVYFLRFTGSGVPDVVRLARLPRLLSDGLSPTRVRLAVAAPVEAFVDGAVLIRNNSDQAVAYVEDGPLYGPFSVEVPDTVNVLDQPVRLLTDAGVRVAALSSDGERAAYIDVNGRLFTLSVDPVSPPEEVISLRGFFGPVTVSGLQWAVGDTDLLFISLDRGLGPESWTVRVSIRQLGPAVVDALSIREPGAGALEDVNLFTEQIPAGLWRVPAPERFTP